MYIIALSHGETNLFLKKTSKEGVAHRTFMLLGSHGNIIHRFLGLTQNDGHKISVLKIENGSEHFPIWAKAKDLLYAVMEAELLPAEGEVIDLYS